MTATPELGRIFALDPRQCTREDLDAIIIELRAKKRLFNNGAIQAGNMKPKTEKEKAALSLAKALDLGDL